jgi:aspartate/methionine/tyrosine aminotransferase
MSQSNLSSRAQTVVTNESTNPFYEIIKDEWNPTTNPKGYVNVGVAENTLMHTSFIDYINKPLTLPAKYLTYNEGGSGSTRLKKSIAGFLNKHLKPVVPLQAGHLLPTNGLSSALEHVSWAFADPDEGILLGRPYYGMFIPDLSLRTGSVVVPVKFDDVDPLAIDAVGKYEDAILDFKSRTGKNVKVLMLCHPHNPLGRCYPRDVLMGLMRLCQRYRIHFVSDEIYALSTFENGVDDHPPPVSFESALSIDLSGVIDPSLVHVLWGMSKDFGANGIRLGVIISQANADMHLALSGNMLYSSISGTADHLVSLMLEDFEFTDWYVARNRELLAEGYRYTTGYLREHGIEYATGCNAGFFVWMDLGKRFCELHPGESADGNVGEKVMQRLLGKKVFLASGALFGSERDGWFRIVFTQGYEILGEALGRIVAALEG